MDDTNDYFLYNNTPISFAKVLNYLLRVEPFTTEHIDFQSGRFDVPGRQFSSIEKTFDLLTSPILDDVSEIIPEFFFFERFLLNDNHINLGITKDNLDINLVQLPKWCQNDPMKFIYMNRKALESDFVSSNLHHWIDHMFGSKQKDEESYNVFSK